MTLRYGNKEVKPLTGHDRDGWNQNYIEKMFWHQESIETWALTWRFWIVYGHTSHTMSQTHCWEKLIQEWNSMRMRENAQERDWHRDRDTNIQSFIR